MIEGNGGSERGNCDLASKFEEILKSFEKFLTSENLKI